MPNLVARSGLISICIIAGFVFCGPGMAQGPEGEAASETAESPSWDQAKVIRLADEVEMRLLAALDARDAAPPQRTALQQRERDAAVAGMRRAADASTEYAKRIRAGWGRGDSEVYFRAVAENFSEILKTAGDAVPSERVGPLIDRVQHLLDELSAMYAIE